MAKWSELPSEILYSISLSMNNPFDLIHFRSVCSFWRSSSLLKFRPKTPLRCPPPLDSGGCGDDCHILRSRIYLVKSSDRNGPPRYWLFKQLDKENGDIVLHNLFMRRNSSGYRCLFPTFSLDLLSCQVFELVQEHIACFSEWSEIFECVWKGEVRIGFMSLKAENNEFMVLGHLTFTTPDITMYRSIDRCWTDLKIAQPDAYLEGIVSYKSKFYAIDRTGRTIVVEPTLEVTTFQRSRPCDKTRKRWLLNSGDKLLLVELCTESRYDFVIPNVREKNIWFEVSELDVERHDWNQVEDVDGRVLFLENIFSFSCLATEIQGFRANSIIFLNLWVRDKRDESILVYEFDEHGVRSLEDIPEYVKLFPSPPGWVISNARS
ncbi:unnamed protein product [Eruca vesicaria subsp. sativa]|uniref:KIB1-4 beta-propeller domain-containing protein n=1 Tax=Eruca vesicaria subsp. sativa TaxID=29727 RepID=A0ABC8K1S0_ERUVS|nr:unnamed protein product [Eruca vesicaria subsp. sativa]